MEHEFYILYCVILIIGVSFLLHFLYLMYLSMQTYNWLKVDATILSKSVELVENLGKTAGNTYKVILNYKYIFRDKEYFCNKIFYGDYISINLRSNAQELLDQFIDMKTFAYVNPYNPMKAVLRKGIHPIIFLELFIGLIFIGLFFILRHYKLILLEIIN